MAKKGGAGGAKNKVKKGAPKAKKSGQFKALAKTETRQAVVQTEKKNGNVQQKVKAKKTFRVSDEFRNFDERMAATRMKKQQTKAAPAPRNSVVAAPSFVMAAPTFQFNNAPVPVQEAPREVEGFHGFLSALQEPATAPQAAAPRKVQSQRVEMPRNVFAVLDDDEDVQQPPVQAVAPPSFMQPATFSFNTGFNNAASAGTSGLTSLQRSILGYSAAAPSPFAQRSAFPAREIDPDL